MLLFSIINWYNGVRCIKADIIIIIIIILASLTHVGNNVSSVSKHVQ
jgi:hypothetical protein